MPRSLAFEDGHHENVSLPDALKEYVDEQVAQRGFATSSEYVRELIRRDQDQRYLRELLLAGAGSPPALEADAKYFEGMRRRVLKGGRSGKEE